MEKKTLDRIEEAIAAVKNGEVIIVVDDDNRENEGDFLTAAENISPEDHQLHGQGRAGINLCSFDRKTM